MAQDSSPRRFIITGMSGTGKTAVLEALRREGHACFTEPARLLLEARLPEQGDGFASSFIQLMVERSRADHEAVEGGVAFYDRGLPDAVAYSVRFGVAPGAARVAAETHRYESDVFVAPPWPEIFVHDEYRRAPFDEYLRFHELLLRTYRDLGYSLIDLPKVPVAERVNFIRAHVACVA